MNAELFARACRVSPIVARTWFGPIASAMAEQSINTPARQAAFLAQVCHESLGFRWVREKWGPTPAQERYEMNARLGNTQPGDGERFLGRGPIQLTGRNNYRDMGAALGVDLEQFPSLLEGPQLGARSAAYFWRSHGCNELADVGDFVAITKRINGGTNGLADRQRRWAIAREALNV